MKTTLPVLITAFMLLAATGLEAGEITVYKDQDGVINLTDRPAPADARIQLVIPYKEKSAAELEQQRIRDEETRQAAVKQEKYRNTMKLKEEANQASAEAARESALAREKIKAAEAYLKRYKQRGRKQRRRYRKTAQQVAREAQNARDRANAAINRANQALEKVRGINADEAGTLK